MNKLILLATLTAALAGCTPTPAKAELLTANLVSEGVCAAEGYTGTKLEWCKNICERGYTGETLTMWKHRWINRYRTLPTCAVD